ncbi:MAG: hypothetical protein HDS08_00560 [Bacteroides sp.]|nr:hypothetical protein [Bacteroides sp.]
MKSILGTVRRSDIIFRANGHFDVTARVVRALNISPGDAVDVLSDGIDYFLYVSRHVGEASWGRFEAQVYPSCKRGKHFRGSSIRLCKAMLEASGADKKAALPCGEVVKDKDGRLLMPIIVKLNLAKSC